MNWWEQDPRKVVSRIYWLRGQLPPKDWQRAWPEIKKQLEVKYPMPTMLRN